MTTSGTVAKTVLDTATLLEHAFRRVKVLPAAQTPETVEIAKNCMYMLLLNLSNRGINLWCVDKVYLGLLAGKATYHLPEGVLETLNVSHCRPTLVTGTVSGVTGGYELALTSPVSAIRLGVKFSSNFTGVLVVAGTSQASASYEAGQFYWFDIDKVSSSDVYQVTSSLPISVSDIQAVVSSYELPMSAWNRDTYVAINGKSQQGSPCTNYFPEKKLRPQITVWPVPNSDTDHLLLFVHRQAQDVGALVQQIEIPPRWLDGFIYLLADRLCDELQNIDPTVAQRISQKAQMQVFEAELAEGDGAPIFLSPNIGVYTA